MELEELLDRMQELLHFVEQDVSRNNPPTPQLAVLSLSAVINKLLGTPPTGEVVYRGRHAVLTFAKTTQLSDEAKRAVIEILEIFERVSSECLGNVAGSDPFTREWVKTTLLRGKASATVIQVNISGNTVVMPPENLLAELQIVVTSARQAYSFTRSVTKVIEVVGGAEAPFG
ncbi:hypothetical protein [Thermofilum pendens]|uniref:Uncharacterized protein n=1 Tax=Thermofilum pendens (strain DSM 2475 / Hrk 5) TaxID=368408 RepID=A1S1F5_THEPD|nr:hypothetical protein [Thermofilum pendens]ABL79285.1 hypothetical protein Tpen_1890 [Thermofilum pendens Hrk 5]